MKAINVCPGTPVEVVHLHFGEITLHKGVVVSAPTEDNGSKVLVRSKRTGRERILELSDPFLLSLEEAEQLINPQAAVERFKGRLGYADSVLVSDLCKATHRPQLVL